MSSLMPINLKGFVQQHRDLLKPPVGNKMVWQNREFLVMVVGGPNQRKDFHVEDGEEFFYQIEGDITCGSSRTGKYGRFPSGKARCSSCPPGFPTRPSAPRTPWDW